MPTNPQWREGLRRRGTPVQDRRANSRIKTCLSCEVRSGGEAWDGCLVSMSLTGALVSSRRGVPKNSDLSIAIEVPPSGEKVLLKGHVVRTSRLTLRGEETCMFGVHFNAVSYESMLLVNALLATRRH